LNLQDLLKVEVKDVKLSSKMSVLQLIQVYDLMGGFTAKHLAEAHKIACSMFMDDDCTVFLSFTGNLIATGLRGVIADLISRGYVDVIITTGGAIDHDIARSFGGKYYHGSFDLDDVMLSKLSVHRLGNVLVPLESYGAVIESVTWKILDELVKEKHVWGVRELLAEFGRRIDDENSFLRQAYLRNVPVYVPGILDSSFGTQLFMYSQSKSFSLDPLADMKELSDIVFDAVRTGALVIGGGISKHHTIWWNQFKGGLEYAIYITTAVEYDGSLSGARVKEAISWGKVKPEAKRVTVYGDATIILPLLLASVYEAVECGGHT